MSEKSFRPQSKRAERKIIRQSRSFKNGVLYDVPLSSIPETGLKYLRNMLNWGNRLETRGRGRSVCQFPTLLAYCCGRLISASVSDVTPDSQYGSCIYTITFDGSITEGDYSRGYLYVKNS